MKKIIILLIAVTFLNSCKKETLMSVKYPQTKKVDSVDVYFGNKIEDPYRWLEDDRSAETEAWVKAQNEITFGYLNKIPFRNNLKNRLEKLWNFERIGTPFKEGDFMYFFKNNGLQDQNVLYQQANEKEAIVFLDPNTFSKDKTTSLGEFDFSKDGKYIAYSISEGGSDWRKIIVKNTETNTIEGDTIIDVKFTSISWKGNDGFFYSSYDKPTGSELSAKTDQHKLYYHKLGTPQKDDAIIFGNSATQKRRYVSGSVTFDNRFLFISAAESTSGNELYMLDLTSPKNKIVQIVKGFETDNTILDNKENKLYIVTNLNAPNKRIITVDAENPTPQNWVDLIPETSSVLTPTKCSGYIFANYMIDAVSKVKQYDYDGKFIRDISLPGLGTASGFSGKLDDEFTYYSFTNYITPNTSFKLNPITGESTVFYKPVVDFNSDNYESKQVFYTSIDGTKIPMIITYKKGTKLDGKNPTMLYAYGGFNISITPSFSIPNAVWLENGGVYAVPNIRGGGEYGDAWHNAGIQLKKQNVFDDFIAAAEYLINNNYTSSDYLAIQGRSNGGLLIGAVMTQRPTLAKVALPGVGVLDMLRYHKFTAGAGWAYDYGTSDQSVEMFKYLKNYSPLHNVVDGIEYPATLITTADHDDRVVPAHSFKFAATLQSKQIGNNPILIRIETNAGHGAGTPVSKSIEQYADLFSFTLYNMGIKELSIKN